MNDRPGPAVRSVSQEAIRRRLLAEAGQHPATLLPLTGCAMSAIYLVLLEPVFGHGAWAMGLVAVSGLSAAGSFVWLYIFRHSEEYARRARELTEIADREREEEQTFEASRLRESLQAGFSTISGTKGVTTLSGLVDEYERLHPALTPRDSDGPLNLSHVPGLAEETYRRGLSVLSDALDVMNAAEVSGRNGLEKRTAELENELESQTGSEQEVGRLAIVEASLASHKQRLHMLDRLDVRADELVFQAERCEASLHRARMELAAIKAGSSETSVNFVTEALQGTITQVKEVQIELRKLGY